MDIMLKEGVIMTADKGHEIDRVKSIDAGLSMNDEVMKYVAMPYRFLGYSPMELESKYRAFLQEAIDKILTEKRIMPKAVLVAPLLDHVKFVFDEPDLSELFSNLLANAMNEDVQYMVHPAFNEIIKQMSPLDAVFLYRYFENRDLVELESIEWEYQEDTLPLVVDSLLRLGIIQGITYDDRDDVAYELTSMGQLFRNLCVLKPADYQKRKAAEQIPVEGEIHAGSVGLQLEETFGSARFSDDDTMHIRTAIQKEDIINGSYPVLVLQVYNLRNEEMNIIDCYIDGVENCFVPLYESSVCIMPASKHRFVFLATSDNQMLQTLVKNKGTFVLNIDGHVYDIPIDEKYFEEMKFIIPVIE